MVLAISTSSLFACNKTNVVTENPKEQMNEVKRQNQEKSVQVKNKDNLGHQLDISQLSPQEKLALRSKLKKLHLVNGELLINDEKFELMSKTFKKGAKVHNLSMGEYGTVKGSLVIVSANSSLDKLRQLSILKEKYTINQIAKDTYRLQPVELDDIYNLYQNLLKESSFSVVEMEIDYSGFTIKAEER